MERRTLRFEALPDVVKEARALLAGGYLRAGTWNLGQVSTHLATVITMSLDGFPWYLWWPLYWLPRWFALGSILRREAFTRTVSAPKFLMPPDVMEDVEGVARLESAVGRFVAHTGELHPSPIFGPLTPEQWREVHLWHCEHHFSFLIPGKGAGQP